MIDSNFNAELFITIKKKYKTQQLFAKKAGYSQYEISRIVHGKLKIEKKEQKRWAELLGVHIREIFKKGSEKKIKNTNKKPPMMNWENE